MPVVAALPPLQESLGWFTMMPGQPYLADRGVALADLVGAGPSCGVGGGEPGVLDVGDVLGDGCSTLSNFVNAAN